MPLQKHRLGNSPGDALHSYPQSETPQIMPGNGDISDSDSDTGYGASLSPNPPPAAISDPGHLLLVNFTVPSFDLWQNAHYRRELTKAGQPDLSKHYATRIGTGSPEDMLPAFLKAAQEHVESARLTEILVKMANRGSGHETTPANLPDTLYNPQKGGRSLIFESGRVDAEENGQGRDVASANLSSYNQRPPPRQPSFKNMFAENNQPPAPRQPSTKNLFAETNQRPPPRQPSSKNLFSEVEEPTKGTSHAQNHRASFVPAGTLSSYNQRPPPRQPPSKHLFAEYEDAHAQTQRSSFTSSQRHHNTDADTAREAGLGLGLIPGSGPATSSGSSMTSSRANARVPAQKPIVGKTFGGKQFGGRKKAVDNKEDERVLWKGGRPGGRWEGRN